MPSSDSDQLMQYILGKWISKPIHVAAALGIADILGEGPLPVDDLAHRCNAHSPSLYRILRALAAVGIFCESDPRVFSLTPMAECLRKDRLGPIALMFHSAWHDRAWDHLLPSVQSGHPAFEIAYGSPAYEWFGQHPEAADEFHSANAVKAHRFHQAFLEAFDFAGVASVADIGGGHGALMIEILSAYSHLNGMIFDVPGAAKIAQSSVNVSGLDQRCRVITGDFFIEIPDGADIYVLANVLHNWDDTRCRRILSNCRTVMQPGAELLIVEAIISSGNTFSIAKLLDIEAMVMGGGQERTEEEYRHLLADAGFKGLKVNAMKDGNTLLVSTRG